MGGRPGAADYTIMIAHDLETAISSLRDLIEGARTIVPFTGAGISTECGIPDFRSPGGVWEKFDPFEYAYIDTFLANPEKSWILFHEIGKILIGKEPNPAHYALADALPGQRGRHAARSGR
jgi:NAD-dependent deacetylase